MSRVVATSAVSILLSSTPIFADNELFDRAECKKSSFEERFYYSLERLDELSSAQKTAINGALREFQAKRRKNFYGKCKKILKQQYKKKAIIKKSDDSSAELLSSIHK